MLSEKDWPSNGVARTTCAVYDQTEPEPIPKGALVEIQDFYAVSFDEHMWVIEYEGRVYLAEPQELKV